MAVLKQLPTERMWSLYLEMLLELNQDVTDLHRFKKNLLRDAFKGAHNAGCMQEKYYLLWVSVCYFNELSNTYVIVKALTQKTYEHLSLIISTIAGFISIFRMFLDMSQDIVQHVQ